MRLVFRNRGKSRAEAAFGICALSLEAFLWQNALSGLPHVNLEAQISWQARALRIRLKVLRGRRSTL